MTQVTSSRGQELATRLQETTSEFAAFVDSLTPQEWAMRGRNAPDWQLGEDEKRPVGTIAYHTASIISTPHLSLVRDAAEGRPLDPVQGWSVEAVAEGNAAFAEQHADVTKPQVLELLTTNTASALELIGGLSDEQLQRDIGARDQQALLQWCGEARTVDQLIEQLLIGHILLHRSSLRATVGR
jgi:hypothetical protein